MTKRYNQRLNFLYLKIAGIILIPAILFFLPYNFFDNRGPVCIITLLSGYECPGCGMTRACQRLIHFRIEEAWQFNKISIIVYPILVYLWLEAGWITLKQIRRRKQELAQKNKE